MSSARYVGRVGALAVALGIGAVIAGVPGVAWADTEGESDAPGVSAPVNPDSSAGDPSDRDIGGGDLGDSGDGDGVGDAGDPGDVDGADDSAGGMQVGQLRRADHVDVARQCGGEVQAEGWRRRSAEEAIDRQAEDLVSGAVADQDDDPIGGEDGGRSGP